MKAVLSVLVLLALTDAAAGLFLRTYIYYSMNLSWTDARTYCSYNYEDLSAFDTEYEVDSFINQTTSLESDSCWIGLRKKANEASFTHWSDGSVLEFSMWKNGHPDINSPENCAFIRNDEWEDDNCATAMPFACYAWSPQMIVVQEMMTWEEALMYCRTHYTDLVSLNTETDFFLLNKMSTYILTSTFWTGLRFMDGSWFWVNQDSVGSLTSMPLCPASPFQCGALDIKAGIWENRDCEEEMNFICYVW